MKHQHNLSTRQFVVSRELRMTLLALTFPALTEGTPGIEPWDALELAVGLPPIPL